MVGGSLACVLLNLWLVSTGHYRLPLFIFLAFIIGLPLVIRKLPPVTNNPQVIKSNRIRAASSLRRLGWTYVAGLIIGTLNLLTGGLKDAPLWAGFIAIGWIAFMIWVCFWAAKRYRTAAAESQEGPR
jgi:hypothetical protein